MKQRLLDSNIIIYASKPGYDFLRDHIRNKVSYVSVISQIEVLGYHKIKEVEESRLKAFFDAAPLIKISDNIIDRAIEARKSYKLTLGDSIIAATALEHDLELSTSNVKDFEKIQGLTLIDPFEVR